MANKRKIKPQTNFSRNMDFEYGIPKNLGKKIRRIIANNPSNFTLYGTGTYIIGKGNVAIIDPGPDDDQHINSLLKALEKEKITHIFVTHTHKDHSPAAKKIHKLTKAPVYGFGKHPKNLCKDLSFVEEGIDYDFSPTIKINDNEIFKGENWTIKAIHTPGHTSNHVCYELIEESTLFSGDHLMGWSTTVIAPPDGSMSDYLISLRKLLNFSFKICWPTHGPPIENVSNFIELIIKHREHREKQILKTLEIKDNINEIVKELYKDKDPALFPAASLSVLAHLIFLVEKGKVISEKKITLGSKFRIV
ncbi:MAG: MBL fold metallo-hydrolase [Rhodospirillaceae bacterium]|nr:MBL fold metallo-hydrolase [Rhodospirillaceae bacterium]